MLRVEQKLYTFVNLSKQFWYDIYFSTWDKNSISQPVGHRPLEFFVKYYFFKKKYFLETKKVLKNFFNILNATKIIVGITPSPQQSKTKATAFDVVIFNLEGVLELEKFRNYYLQYFTLDILEMCSFSELEIWPL